MLVNQDHDHITHAVVGQQEVIEMGMSDSAFLMHTLSATLYGYPVLAAVRETTCNGWDAHISAGKTDVPLQITLGDDYISIRDFGSGIPHEKIGPIYGVYGDSTKRNDSTVTGGFGLGSKSPFAVTDNFQVTSCHGGTKTIYRVSKSAMAIGGKPAINKIVAVPCGDETGIEVMFHFTKNQHSEVESALKEVLFLGGIMASVNEEPPEPVLETHLSETGYMVTTFKGTLMDQLSIRYGNVVYPLPHHEFYKDEWMEVQKLMRTLNNNLRIVFMAKPDSISIAPSRENLILTEFTLKSIKELLKGFHEQGLKNRPETLRQLSRYILNKTLDTCQGVPTNAKELVESPGLVETEFNPRSFSRLGNYSSAQSVRKMQVWSGTSSAGEIVTDYRVRREALKKLIKHGQNVKHGINVGYAKALLKCARADVQWEEIERRSRAAYAKHVIQPIKAIMAEHAESVKFVPGRLQVLVEDHYSRRNLKDVFSTREFRNTHAYYMPLVFKKIEIYGSKGEACRAAMAYSVNSRSCGTLYYYTNGSYKQAELIAQLFRDLGYAVEQNVDEPDRTPRAVREVGEFDARIPAKAPTPKRKGFYSVASLWDGVKFNIHHAREQEAPVMVTDPVCYVVAHAPSDDRSSCLPGYNRKLSQIIRKEFGDRIAVITVSSQIDKLKEKGVPEMSEFINDHVDNTLINRPDLGRYFAFGYRLENNVVHRHRDAAYLLKLGVQHKELADAVGLRMHVSPETLVYASFLEEHRMAGFPKVNAFREKVPVNKALQAKLEQLADNPLRYCVNYNYLADKLQDVSLKPELREKALAIATIILKD